MAERVHFLTLEGRRKLEKELEFLRTVRRAQVAANLKAAVEGGDLTENSGYEESKREQSFVEGRIRDVETILATAQVLTSQSNHNQVTLGAHITVAEEGCDPETYQLVGRAEADPSKGRISNESPLGQALLGRQIGDKIRVNTPSGVVCFEIISIK